MGISLNQRPAHVPMHDPQAARALASRILDTLFDRTREVSEEDRQALLALAGAVVYVLLAVPLIDWYVERSAALASLA